MVKLNNVLAAIEMATTTTGPGAHIKTHRPTHTQRPAFACTLFGTNDSHVRPMRRMEPASVRRCSRRRRGGKRRFGARYETNAASGRKLLTINLSHNINAPAYSVAYMDSPPPPPPLLPSTSLCSLCSTPIHFAGIIETGTFRQLIQIHHLIETILRQTIELTDGRV